MIHVDSAADALGPRPWANIVANSRFGFAATESGPGFTWSENSHDNRLTPWHNDPVSDPSGEAVFIRDEETGRFWSATPLPAGDGRRFTVRHGQGYTAWEHTRDEITSNLRVFVPIHQTVKVFQLVLRNASARPRECSITLYAEWVLGENPSRTALAHRHEPGAHDRSAAASQRLPPVCGPRGIPRSRMPAQSGQSPANRTEFIGRNGTLRQPAALMRDACRTARAPSS